MSLNTRYLAIAGRIRGELLDLNQVVERALQIWQEGTAQSLAGDYYVDAVALNLHSFYSGVERLFEVIADAIDETKPSGSSWHQQLLQQMMADIPGIRPAVISGESRKLLDRYRGFRHVVRNVYTFTLDPEQIELLIKYLRQTMIQITQELSVFADWLEQLALSNER